MAGEIVKRQPSVLASAQIMGEEQFDNVFRMAKALVASGMFKDVTHENQAFARIVLGADLGLSPTQALMGIDVVEGNARVRSQLLAGWVRKHPDYDYKVLEHDAQHCAIEFSYKGEPQGVSAFSMEDAENAKLVKDHPKSPWRAHPRNMLWARAMSNGVRWYCPDLTGGIPVYTEADEFVDSTAQEIAAGEGDGSEQGWDLPSLDLVQDVEAVLFVAETFGAPMDRASVQLRLNGQPESVVKAWIADTQDTLSMREEKARAEAKDGES